LTQPIAMLTRLFAARTRKNQQQIAGRVAEVVGRVLFDIGVDGFVNGTILVDTRWRVRFFGGTPPRVPGIIAAVALRELAEARACLPAGGSGVAGAPPEAWIGTVVSALMRELNARSPQLRALPAESA
jgi:hypothetical protein